MLEINSLGVNYRGIVALSDISLLIKAGKMVGLIGPNGAGKTTLLKAILGLVPIDRGWVQLWGRPIRCQRQRLAYVPQRSEIDWDFPITVHRVVQLSCTTPERVRSALERTEMWNLRHRPINQLSGGQQQRIFLARALAQNADLFLLDEPFSAVDKYTQTLILEIYRELTGVGKTILISCHEWAEGLSSYDELILLNQSVIDFGCPSTVLQTDKLNLAYSRGGHLVSKQQLSFFC